MAADKSAAPILVELDSLGVDEEGFTEVGTLNLSAKVESEGFNKDVSINASTELDIPLRKTVDGEEVRVRKRDLRRVWIDDLPNSVLGSPDFDFVETEKVLHLEVSWNTPQFQLTKAPLDLSVVSGSTIVRKEWFMRQIREQIQLTGSDSEQRTNILSSMDSPTQVLGSSKLTGSVTEGFGRGKDGELQIELEDQLPTLVIPVFTTEDIPVDIEGTQFERLQEEWERSNQSNSDLVNELFSPLFVFARFSGQSNFFLGSQRQEIAETSVTLPASSVIEIVELTPRSSDAEKRGKKEIHPV